MTKRRFRNDRAINASDVQPVDNPVFVWQSIVSASRPTPDSRLPLSRWVCLVAALAMCLIARPGRGQEPPESANWPSVGVASELSSVVLPGTKLIGKPLINDAPMVVQVMDAFKHGDGFRYDLKFQGFEAGKFDLAKWLVREDGSAIGDLPKIEVEVVSLLPPGIQNPNELESGRLPNLGGYATLATVVSIVWLVGLLGLIFLRWPKKTTAVSAEPVASLADLLRARLNSVFDGSVQPDQYAEIERMLFGMWRRRLDLEDVSADQALRQIRDHDDAGPLMRQLEQWMHSPQPATNVDLGTLLKPYQTISASSLDRERSRL